MKRLLVLLYVIGVAYADIGLGYHYKVPEKKYEIPIYRLGGNSNQYSSALSSGLASSTLGSSSLDSGSLTSSYGNLASSNLGFGTNFGSSSLGSSYSDFGTRYYPSSGSSGITKVVQPLYQYASNSGLNSGLNSGYQTNYASSSQYQTDNQEKYQQRYDIRQQPTQVFKHIYVHAAPEEPEEPQPQTPIVLPPAQKHYKIIFVKTPTESRRSQTVIPVQPQTEEKTIVYVLVKKPEEQQEVIVPKIEQKPPSKPEVYFIKYKNKEDPQAVINNIVNDYDKGEQASVVNTAVNDESYNSASSVGEGAFDTASVVTEAAFSSTSGFGDGISSVTPDISSSTFNIGLSSGASSTTAGVSENSFNAVSAFDNAYGFPTQFESSTSSPLNGYGGLQGSVYSLATPSSLADFNEGNIASTVATPLVVSTTASSIDYDGVSSVATSQGIPHQTYGIPKFRFN